ncbi:uroporphyrinogen-III synthase, partial [Avibacterium avium]
REPLIYDKAEQVSMLKRAGISEIVVTSKEILRSLLDFVPKNEHNWLMSCGLITISERIAHFAQEKGWQNVRISPKANNSAMLNAVLQRNEV